MFGWGERNSLGGGGSWKGLRDAVSEGLAGTTRVGVSNGLRDEGGGVVAMKEGVGEVSGFAKGED